MDIKHVGVSVWNRRIARVAGQAVLALVLLLGEACSQRHDDDMGQVWATKPGGRWAGFSASAVMCDEKTVVVTGADRSRPSLVFVLDAASGSELSSAELAPPAEGFGRGYNGGPDRLLWTTGETRGYLYSLRSLRPVWAGPTVTGKIVDVAADADRVYVLQVDERGKYEVTGHSAADGSAGMRVSLGGPSAPTQPDGRIAAWAGGVAIGVAGRPLVWIRRDGSETEEVAVQCGTGVRLIPTALGLLVSGSDAVTCVALSDHGVRWKAQPEGDGSGTVGALPSGYRCRPVAAGSRTVVTVDLATMDLVGLDAATGATRWRRPPGGWLDPDNLEIGPAGLFLVRRPALGSDEAELLCCDPESGAVVGTGGLPRSFWIGTDVLAACNGGVVVARGDTVAFWRTNASSDGSGLGVTS